MGARAQVEIKGRGEGSVFLYTHWGAYELPNVLANALNRGRGRWGDTEYLARIIFNEMTRGQEMDETGFGIGTQPHGDNDYPPIEVDDVAHTVTFRGTTLPYDSFIDKVRANELAV